MCRREHAPDRKYDGKTTKMIRFESVDESGTADVRTAQEHQWRDWQTEGID